MANDSFTFRQFTVHQDRCAMKVGTDGVLLGAWATGGRRMLDIGTGTGLVALMMAQRFPEGRVTAVEIDGEACRQALENVQDSPFADRMEVLCSSVQDFQAEEKYDAIVSNPPFYDNSLRCPDDSRSKARHTETLTYRDLFLAADRLLEPDGTFSAVIPTECLPSFAAEGVLCGFSVVRKTLVKTVPRKPARRALVAFSRHCGGYCPAEEVCLMDTDGHRSPWYNALAQDFYLR